MEMRWGPITEVEASLRTESPSLKMQEFHEILRMVSLESAYDNLEELWMNWRHENDVLGLFPEVTVDGF